MLFFISGLVFSEHNLDYGFKAFLRKNARQLLIPYFFFSIIAYLIWLLRASNFDYWKNAVESYEAFFGIFYGMDWNNWLYHNPPLWFFTCLFLTRMLFYVMLRYSKNITHFIIYVVACACVGMALSHYLPGVWLWSGNIAFTAAAFMGMGFLLRGSVIRLARRTSLMWFTFVLVVQLICNHLNGPDKVVMSQNIYNNPAFFYLGAVCAVVFFVKCAQLLNEYRIVNWLGRNIVTLFALHVPVFTVFTGLFHSGMGYSPQQISANPLFFIVYTIGSILLIIPVCLFMNRYLPRMLGRKIMKRKW